MKRREIWMADLNPTIGAEIKKIRPVIIINEDEIGTLPLRIVVPFTDWKGYFSSVPWMVKIEPDENNGLDKVSSADCFQVKSISTMRFIRKMGFIEEYQMKAIEAGLSLVLGL